MIKHFQSVERKVGGKVRRQISQGKKVVLYLTFASIMNQFSIHKYDFLAPIRGSYGQRVAAVNLCAIDVNQLELRDTKFKSRMRACRGGF